MQLGFIGAGEITSSIVTGLSSSGITATPYGCPLAILLSLIGLPIVSKEYRSRPVTRSSRPFRHNRDRCEAFSCARCSFGIAFPVQSSGYQPCLGALAAEIIRTCTACCAIARAVPLPSTAKR